MQAEASGTYACKMEVQSVSVFGTKFMPFVCHNLYFAHNSILWTYVWLQRGVQSEPQEMEMDFWTAVLRRHPWEAYSTADTSVVR